MTIPPLSELKASQTLPLNAQVIADLKLPGLHVAKSIRATVIGRTAGSSRASPSYDLLTRDGERFDGVPETSVRVVGQ